MDKKDGVRINVLHFDHTRIPGLQYTYGKGAREPEGCSKNGDGFDNRDHIDRFSNVVNENLFMIGIVCI